MLRSLKTRLWRGVSLLLTSSPAFVDNYFIPRGFQSPVRLIENKILMLDDVSEKLAGQVEALPRTDLVSDQADCRALVERTCRAI